MAAYIIASYDVVDPSRYESYVSAVIPLLQQHGADVLVADYEADALEGEKRGVHVLLRFESEEAARKWYDDPAYEPVRKIRLSSCTNGHMALAKQFVMPSE